MVVGTEVGVPERDVAVAGTSEPPPSHVVMARAARDTGPLDVAVSELVPVLDAAMTAR